MIAQYRECPERSPEPAECLGHGVYIFVAVMHKVSGENHKMRILALGQFDRFSQIRGRDLTAAMEVGELNDAETGERSRQACNRHFTAVQFQPGRLNEIGRASCR